MSLQDDFDAASERVKTLSESPSNETLLELYSLFKQATSGDASGKKPSRLKVVARAKFEAWESRAGMDSDQAKREYIKLVDSLVAADQ